RRMAHPGHRPLGRPVGVPARRQRLPGAPAPGHHGRGHGHDRLNHPSTTHAGPARTHLVWDPPGRPFAMPTPRGGAVPYRTRPPLWETTMTTTIMTATAAGTRTRGSVTDRGLGPVTYRPGTGPETPGLVLYAVISVRGQL